MLNYDVFPVAKSRFFLHVIKGHLLQYESHFGQMVYRATSDLYGDSRNQTHGHPLS